MPCTTVEYSFGGSPVDNGCFGIGQGVGFVVVKGRRGRSCGAGDETLKGIINGNNKGWKGQETTGRVCDEGAAFIVISMDAGGEKKHVEVGHVETLAKTYGVAAEDDTERAVAHNVDASAVSHSGVVVVCVGNVVLKEFLNRTHITGSPAVDTRVCSQGLESA